MTLRSDLEENRWLRAQFVILILGGVYAPVAALLTLLTGSAWVLAPVAVYFAAGMVCWVPSRRADRALKAARATAEAEAAKLRTLAAPDAVWPQCPVCGMDDLDDLADDDAFMDRGGRSRVVAYGTRRAHWDCAELVPYVEPSQHFETVEIDGHKLYCACKRCETAAYHPGAYYRCRFCGFYRRALSKEAAREKLTEHTKTCSRRPGTATSGRLRASAFDAYMRETEVKLAEVAADLDMYLPMLKDVKGWKR